MVAAETTISLVDGQAGRLLYRGYEIGDLAAHGSYDRVVGLLLDGEWPLRDEVLPPAELSPTGAGRAARTADLVCTAGRAAHRGLGVRGGAPHGLAAHAEQARELIALGPAAVGAFARLRDGKQPVELGGVGPPGIGRAAAARDHAARSPTPPRRARWTPTSPSVPSTA